MATDWAGVDKAVYTNYTLATDALVLAFRTFYLQMLVLFQANVAPSPFVFAFYSPTWHNGKMIAAVLRIPCMNMYEGFLNGVVIKFPQSLFQPI